MSKKKFVLDTNVILHDSDCIYNFDEHDIYLSIVVLEELDTFKSNKDTLGFHARNFVRKISEFSPTKMLNGGLSLGDGKGAISIRVVRDFTDKVKSAFRSVDKPDHHILNLVELLREEFPENEVILVSKDVNLRMKAFALGLVAQDYTTDAVDTEEIKYDGYSYVKDAPTQVIDILCGKDGFCGVEDVGKTFVANEYAILQNGSTSALARYDKRINKLYRVNKATAYGITSKNVEQLFALNALLDPTIPLVTITGKAGTGKTLLALAAALENRKYYRQILVTRPIVPLSNKDIGALPGEIKDKIGPYMIPLFDNLGVIRSQFSDKSEEVKTLNKVIEEEKLKIEPLAYIRGRSLVRMFMIIDESQNLTPHEIKTIITRAGEGTKMVFTGDETQIDHPYLDRHTNGLSYAIAKMKNQHLHAHIKLHRGERSELSDLASDLL